MREQTRDEQSNEQVPCICCPIQVRQLHAVAFNLLNLRSDPDRWHRKIDQRLDELQRAVDALQPFVDAHFSNEAHWKNTDVADEVCRCRQLEKRAKALCLADVMRMEHESDLMKELRNFNLVASLQMRIQELEKKSVE